VLPVRDRAKKHNPVFKIAVLWLAFKQAGRLGDLLALVIINAERDPVKPEHELQPKQTLVMELLVVHLVTLANVQRVQTSTVLVQIHRPCAIVPFTHPWWHTLLPLFNLDLVLTAHMLI
jgi:hypothetical protein